MVTPKEGMVSHLDLPLHVLAQETPKRTCWSVDGDQVEEKKEDEGRSLTSGGRVEVGEQGEGRVGGSAGEGGLVEGQAVDPVGEEEGVEAPSLLDVEHPYRLVVGSADDPSPVALYTFNSYYARTW